MQLEFKNLLIAAATITATSTESTNFKNTNYTPSKKTKFITELRSFIQQIKASNPNKHIVIILPENCISDPKNDSPSSACGRLTELQFNEINAAIANLVVEEKCTIQWAGIRVRRRNIDYWHNFTTMEKKSARYDRRLTEIASAFPFPRPAVLGMLDSEVKPDIHPISFNTTICSTTTCLVDNVTTIFSYNPTITPGCYASISNCDPSTLAYQNPSYILYLNQLYYSPGNNTPAILVKKVLNTAYTTGTTLSGIIINAKGRLLLPGELRLISELCGHRHGTNTLQKRKVIPYNNVVDQYDNEVKQCWVFPDSASNFNIATYGITGFGRYVVAKSGTFAAINNPPFNATKFTCSADGKRYCVFYIPPNTPFNPITQLVASTILLGKMYNSTTHNYLVQNCANAPGINIRGEFLRAIVSNCDINSNHQHNIGTVYTNGYDIPDDIQRIHKQHAIFVPGNMDPAKKHCEIGNSGVITVNTEICRDQWAQPMEATYGQARLPMLKTVVSEGLFHTSDAFALYESTCKYNIFRDAETQHFGHRLVVCDVTYCDHSDVTIDPNELPPAITGNVLKDARASNNINPTNWTTESQLITNLCNSLFASSSPYIITPNIIRNLTNKSKKSIASLCRDAFNPNNSSAKMASQKKDLKEMLEGIAKISQKTGMDRTSTLNTLLENDISYWNSMMVVICSGMNTMPQPNATKLWHAITKADMLINLQVLHKTLFPRANEFVTTIFVQNINITDPQVQACAKLLKDPNKYLSTLKQIPLFLNIISNCCKSNYNNLLNGIVNSIQDGSAPNSFPKFICEMLLSSTMFNISIAEFLDKTAPHILNFLQTFLNTATPTKEQKETCKSFIEILMPLNNEKVVELLKQEPDLIKKIMELNCTNKDMQLQLRKDLLTTAVNALDNNDELISNLKALLSSESIKRHIEENSDNFSKLFKNKSEFIKNIMWMDESQKYKMLELALLYCKFGTLTLIDNLTIILENKECVDKVLRPYFNSNSSDPFWTIVQKTPEYINYIARYTTKDSQVRALQRMLNLFGKASPTINNFLGKDANKTTPQANSVTGCSALASLPFDDDANPSEPCENPVQTDLHVVGNAYVNISLQTTTNPDVSKQGSSVSQTVS